jgi:hypothetical protein
MGHSAIERVQLKAYAHSKDASIQCSPITCDNAAENIYLDDQNDTDYWKAFIKLLHVIYTEKQVGY